MIFPKHYWRSLPWFFTQKWCLSDYLCSQSQLSDSWCVQCCQGDSSILKIWYDLLDSIKTRLAGPHIPENIHRNNFMHSLCFYIEPWSLPDVHLHNVRSTQTTAVIEPLCTIPFTLYATSTISSLFSSCLKLTDCCNVKITVFLHSSSPSQVIYNLSAQ